MSWEIILLAALFTGSLATIAEKFVHKEDKTNPIAFAIIFQFLLGFILLFVGIVINDFQFQFSPEILPNLAIMVVLYGFGNVMFFKGLKNTEASIFTIISSLTSLFTIISSSLLLRISLTGLQITGVLLIIASVIIVNWKGKKLELTTGVIFTILGAMFFGTEVTNDSTMLSRGSIYVYLFLSSTLPAILMAIVYNKELKGIKSLLTKKVLPKFTIFILLYAAQACMYFTALKMSSNPSLFGGIALSSGIISVILAVVLLKERKDLLKKGIAILISILGLALLTVIKETPATTLECLDNSVTCSTSE